MTDTRDEKLRKERERVRAWRKANPEKSRMSNLKWAMANPDKIREIRRRAIEKYRLIHPERGLESQLRYADSFPDRALWSSYKGRAKRKSIGWSLDRETFSKLVRAECWYCGSPACENTSTRRAKRRNPLNGLDRLDNLLGYIDGNVVTACWVCNRMKGATNINSFIARVSKIASRMRSMASAVS